MELESGCGLDYIVSFGLVVISSWWLVELARGLHEMDAPWSVHDWCRTMAPTQQRTGPEGSAANGGTLAGDFSNSLNFN